MSQDQFERVLSEIEDCNVRLSRIEVLLTGNGDPSKGFIVRVDRLERFVKYATTAMSITYTATVGALLTWLFSRG